MYNRKSYTTEDGKIYEQRLSPYAGVYSREVFVPKHIYNKPIIGPYLMSYLRNVNCLPY